MGNNNQVNNPTVNDTMNETYSGVPTNPNRSGAANANADKNGKIKKVVKWCVLFVAGVAIAADVFFRIYGTYQAKKANAKISELENNVKSVQESEDAIGGKLDEIIKTIKDQETKQPEETKDPEDQKPGENPGEQTGPETPVDETVIQQMRQEYFQGEIYKGQRKNTAHDTSTFDVENVTYDEASNSTKAYISVQEGEKTALYSFEYEGNIAEENLHTVSTKATPVFCGVSLDSVVGDTALQAEFAENLEADASTKVFVKVNVSNRTARHEGFVMSADYTLVSETKATQGEAGEVKNATRLSNEEVLRKICESKNENIVDVEMSK